ncbi:hypothetical protein [Nocardiopsis suaedae]|uniref:DUF3592 domain-containing protein n=1 Tax=Nocardiopsis suaedae TaxID=3018444 RepID=A0ABT4TKF5_9ACTN|nr:hypothetical protein [Nocardiopsis suaedae]MDA2805140.1 hypothetical protein [Nocardiopsis suaedae]
MTNYWEREPKDQPASEEISLPTATRLLWAMVGLMFLAGVLHYAVLPYTAGFILLCLAWPAAACCAGIWAYAASVRFRGLAVGFAAVLVLAGSALFLARAAVYHVWADEVRCTVAATSTWDEMVFRYNRRGGGGRPAHEVEWECAGERVTVKKAGTPSVEEGETQDMAYDPEGRLPLERARKVMELWIPGSAGAISLGVVMYLGRYPRRPAWTRTDKA